MNCILCLRLVINLNWKIGANKKTINGYVCQEAEGVYLGRKYTVWFALEIPLQNGS